jgi:hypothetical protein
MVGGSLVAPAAAQAARPAPFGHPCSRRRRPLLPDADARGPRAQLRRYATRRDVTLPADAKENQALQTILIMHGWAAARRASSRPRRRARARPPGAGTTSTTRSVAMRSWTTRRAGRALLREGRRTRPAPPTASPAEATSTSRTAAGRTETRSICSGCSPTRESHDRMRSARPASHMGAGRALSLPSLRNRIQLPNGSFAPWKSPGGRSLSLTAAFPRWPWSDLNARSIRTVASSTPSRRA